MSYKKKKDPRHPKAARARREELFNEASATAPDGGIPTPEDTKGHRHIAGPRQAKAVEEGRHSITRHRARHPDPARPAPNEGNRAATERPRRHRARRATRRNGRASHQPRPQRRDHDRRTPRDRANRRERNARASADPKSTPSKRRTGRRRKRKHNKPPDTAHSRNKKTGKRPTRTEKQGDPKQRREPKPHTHLFNTQRKSISTTLDLNTPL